MNTRNQGTLNQFDVLRAAIDQMEAAQREADEQAKQPAPPQPDRPRLLTVAEASKELRVSRAGLYRLFRSGRLRWVQVGAHRRVSTAEVERFISEQTMATRMMRCSVRNAALSASRSRVTWIVSWPRSWSRPRDRPGAHGDDGAGVPQRRCAVR